jgi:hypothetical protein
LGPQFGPLHETMDLLLASIRWRPGIGDPSFMGWFTVFAYACGAVLALVANQSDPPGENVQQRRIRKRLWLAVAFVMLCLCFNKQLDLQSLFTDIARVIATEQGWYAERRGVQKLFILLVFAGAAAFGGWLMWRFQAFWRSHKVLLAGLLFLLTFIVVRAVSFHHVDVFLGRRVFGFKMNWALELTGIGLVCVAAIMQWRARSKTAR